MLEFEGYLNVKWFKRYVISGLIALLLLAGMDAYHRPGKELREGALILMAAFWPVAAAIVVGSTVGEIVWETKQKKLG
jgi:hypothetical protein